MARRPVDLRKTVPDPVAHLSSALAGRYRVERELGAGGMATVYLAEDLKHHRQVAIKVLREDLAASLGTERFVREINIAAGLTHPHILPLHDSGEAGGRLFYVMPYVDGPTLRQKLVRHGELPIAEAVRILRDIADALSFAHRHGVVHRDIKPENVMLADRHALVTDFGVAKAISEATGRQTLTTIGVALGTPAYMAPEQATADPHLDHRSDIYAFGVVAYELIAGRPPFMGGTPHEVLAAHVTRAVEPVTNHRTAVPPTLAALIMRCLEKRPADRWQSAEELIPQLEAVLTPSGGTTPTMTQPLTGVSGAALPAAVRRRRWIIAGVATAAAMLAAGAGYWVTRPTGVIPGRVAVLPFENKTGDALLDDRGARLAEATTEAIGREGAGEPVAAATIRDLAVSGGDASALTRSVSRRTGAELVVRGSYYKAQAGVEVRVEVLRMPALEQRFAFTATGRPDSDSLMLAVAERVQVALTLEKEWGPQVSWQGEHLPASMTAVREFMRSTELEARGDTGWFAAAEASRTADSAWIYPLYQTLRAGILRTTGWTGGWTTGRAALAEFERRPNLTQGDRERLSLARAFLTGDNEGYYVAVKRLFARRPTEYGPDLAGAAWTTLRLNEAVDLRNFLDTPGFWSARERRQAWSHTWVAYSLHLLGRFEEEAAMGRHIRVEFPDLQLAGFNHEMRAAAGLGKFTEVERLVAEMERGAAAGYSASRAWIAALELAAHGHNDASRLMYERAARGLEARLAGGDTTALEASELGWVLINLGRLNEARRVLPILQALGDSLAYQNIRGAIHALEGDRRGAELAGAALARMRFENPYAGAGVVYAGATLAALLGDTSRAMELLRDARRRGYAQNWNPHQDPDLTILRGTPAFEEFMRPRK